MTQQGCLLAGFPNDPAAYLTQATWLQVESVVMYSAEWVRSKTTMGGRMASTSNQETFKAEVEGRLVLDLQRVVLSSHLLPTYGLAEAVNGLLGRPLECIPPTAVAELWNKARGCNAAGRTRLNFPFVFTSLHLIAVKALQHILTIPPLRRVVMVARAACVRTCPCDQR